MTCFLRNAFLALVALATLAIIVMMAMTAEATEAKDSKPATETASTADTARQIVVEEKAKPSGAKAPAKDEAAAEPVKPAETAKTAESATALEAQAESGAPALQARVAEAAPAPKPQIVLLLKPKPHIAYVHRYSGYGDHGGYDHCDQLFEAIKVNGAFAFLKTWMAGTSPAITLVASWLQQARSF